MKNIFVLMATLLMSLNVFGSLGGSVDSIDTDVKNFGGTKTSTQYSNYTLYEITSEIVTIKEYVSGDGVVFAVSWKGITPPDLSGLLGSRYERYKSRNSAERVRRHDSGEKKDFNGERKRGHRVSGGDFVVETFARMRDVHGRAYLKSKLPDGFTVDEIK